MIAITSCAKRLAASLVRSQVRKLDSPNIFHQTRRLQSTSPTISKKLELEPTISNGFRYQLATSADRGQLQDGLVRWFYPEDPVCCAHRDGPKPAKEDIDHCVGLIESGFVLLAFEESSGALAGFNGCSWVRSDYVDYLLEEAANAKERKYRDAMLLLAHCARHAKLCERFGVELACQTQYTGVAAKFRGKALGSELMVKSVEIARKFGAEVISGDCTGSYMARSCQRIGMKCIYEIAYADYRDEKGEVVFHTKPGYEFLQCHAMKLPS